MSRSTPSSTPQVTPEYYGSGVPPVTPPPTPGADRPLTPPKKKRPIGGILLLIFCALIFFSVISMAGSAASRPNVKECLTASNKAVCVEDTVSVRIPDSWTRKCVEANIDGNASLATAMKNNTITDDQIKDVDALVRECYFYRQTQTPTSGYPVFTSFISAAAGSFVGNYLANQWISSERDYRNFGYGRSSNGGGVYIDIDSPSKKRSYDSNYKGSATKKDSLGEVQNQYKNTSWNIQQMKSASATTSNYSLGDTGKKWSSTTTRNSGNSGWSSWTSSPSGSTKSSTLS